MTFVNLPEHQPQYAVSDEHLVTLSDHPKRMEAIPPSRMFTIKKSLQKYRAHAGADAPIYDASQGDGGESLPGVPRAVLEKAAAMQIEAGTGYDAPAGTERFRKATAEMYWKIDPVTGWDGSNIVAVQGGRDGLLKAYESMIHLGYGRVGDVLITSSVPWISYNWGPYAAGLNVLRAPGDANEAWAFTEDALAEAVNFAKKSGRNAAGLLITSPDNPTGRTLDIEQQIALAKKALELGVAYVLFDWIYHWVTQGQPHDINVVLNAFEPAERDRLIFLDGLTKSLGASNIRSSHLVASKKVCEFITSRASHGVITSFFSQAVAIAAYEMGFAQVCKDIIEPTNASRQVLRKFIADKQLKAIMGDGYYGFIDVTQWIENKGLADSAELGQKIAEQFGVAVVPGIFFSEAAKNWVRFSYALPPERTGIAISRFYEGLNGLE
jgi:aspartate aminotransferase